MWKQALSVVFTFDPVPRCSGVRNLLQALQYMYNVSTATTVKNSRSDCFDFDPVKAFMNVSLAGKQQGFRVSEAAGKRVLFVHE